MKVEKEFYGFKRENGNVGARNRVLVVPTVICSNQVAFKISKGIDKAAHYPFSGGCAQLGEDKERSYKTIINSALNPNIGAVLLVGNGCEDFDPGSLSNTIRNRTEKPVKKIIIQEEGGTKKTISRGTKIAKRLADKISNQERDKVGISNLTVATECGGSDTTSGLAANPTTGVCGDIIVEEGGTFIFSETTELIGAEEVIAERAENEKVKNKILKTIKNREDKIRKTGLNIRGTQPTPGNIEGGLSTLAEKSLGMVKKAGSSVLKDVLEYAEIPKKKGLNFMDTTAFDVESMTGMVAAGAQIVLFTTGRGTPVGNPIAPTIKITGNRETAEKMECNMDFDAQKIITKNISIEKMGKKLFKKLIEVANGKKTKAEKLGLAENKVSRNLPIL